MNATTTPAIVPAKTGRTFSVVGDVMSLKISGEQTGGQYALFESIVQPGGGPPPHVHHRESEIFYILEGRVAFHVTDQTIIAEPGATVFAPKGIPHRFENIGSTPLRMLIGISPAGADAFFAEAGDEVPPGTTMPLPVTKERIDKLLSVCPRYGIEILPPGTRLGSQ